MDQTLLSTPSCDPVDHFFGSDRKGGRAGIELNNDRGRENNDSILSGGVLERDVANRIRLKFAMCLKCLLNEKTAYRTI